MSMTPSRRRWESLTLADVAVDNRIYIVRCNLCRRTVHFLATDLALVYGAEHSAHGIFETCSLCRRSRWLHVTTRLPSHLDVGRLVVRRPSRRWRWRDERYGLEG